jgi:hypothetical protein
MYVTYFTNVNCSVSLRRTLWQPGVEASFPSPYRLYPYPKLHRGASESIVRLATVRAIVRLPGIVRLSSIGTRHPSTTFFALASKTDYNWFNRKSRESIAGVLPGTAAHPMFFALAEKQMIGSHV